jgi:hypothetical protein
MALKSRSKRTWHVDATETRCPRYVRSSLNFRHGVAASRTSKWAIKRNDPWFEILTLLGNSTALQAGALAELSQPQGPNALPMVNCMWGP